MYCKKCGTWYEPTTDNLTGFCRNCIPRSWVSNTTTYVGENQPSIKSEQNALEKLGYKEKPCNFGKIFKKDDGTFIKLMRFTTGDTVVEHIQKGNVDCEMTFTSSEILALAEVIKEMENKK